MFSKNLENNSTENNNHAVTSYQAVEYVFWHLRMDKFQIFTKISGKLKNADFIKKILKFDIKMLKNITLLLETMQCRIIKP